LCFNITPLTFENTAIAQNFLAKGKMYYLLDGNVDYNHQFPFYGWILICFFKVFGAVMLPVQIFQIFLNACFAWVVWKLFELKFSSLASKTWISIVLILIASCHPLLVYYQFFTIHPVTLDILLFALLMFVGLVWVKSPTWQMSLILIFTLGITLLERSTLAVAILPTVLFSLKDKKICFQLGMIISVSILVFALPWLVRNHNLTGKYQLTSGTWRYMWVGVQEDTNGTNVLASGESYYSLFPQDIKDSWSDKNLNEQMDFYKESYLQLWDENPSQVFIMWGRKLKNMFWFSDYAGGSKRQSIWLFWYRMMHGFLLLLFLLGFVSEYRKHLLIIASAGVMLALIQSFFYVETRHSLPFHFVLWIGAILGLWYLATRFVQNKNV
jgi:hypothetical protein